MVSMISILGNVMIFRNNFLAYEKQPKKTCTVKFSYNNNNT